MRFLCIYRPGDVVEDAKPPAPEDMQAMGKLIDDMSKAGVLLATGGCQPSAKGARVRVDGGRFTVTDGPFPETKELICGYCLMQTKSKEEAIEWGKRFLAVVGKGESEIRQLYDAPDA